MVKKTKSNTSTLAKPMPEDALDHWAPQGVQLVSDAYSSTFPQRSMALDTPLQPSTETEQMVSQKDPRDRHLGQSQSG